VQTQPGTVAGRYRLIDRLGAGSMGTVWRAEDVSLGREVAVKEVVFPPGVSDREREVLRERTRREARMAAGLDHPNAVTVYDVAEGDDTTYIVMELVPARTLAEVVRGDGPLSPERTAEVGLGVLGALEAAHRRGIVHRDVKPSNVLLRTDGRVVLTDFGIARSIHDTSLTTTGALIGSPAYMSPERARGEVPGPATDLWSLGATLFTAVEGRPPFDRGESLPTLSAVLTEPHAPFAAAGPLAPVLDGLLEKDPALRLDAAATREELSRVAQTRSAPTAAFAATAEDAVADTTTAVPLREVREQTQRDRSRSKRPLLVLLGVVVAALGVGAAAVLVGHGRPSRPVAGTRPAVSTPSAPPAPATAAAPVPAPAAIAPAPPAPTASTTSPAATATAAAPAATPVSAVVPAGWQTYTGPQGWTLAHPAAWRVSSFDGLTQLREDATGRTLRIDTTDMPKKDPVADWRSQARSFSASHPGYSQLSIAPASYRGYNAADWEFTYPAGGTTLHVLDRGFVVSPNRAYGLYWQTRDGDWQAARSTFDQIATSFQPG